MKIRTIIIIAVIWIILATYVSANSPPVIEGVYLVKHSQIYRYIEDGYMNF